MPSPETIAHPFISTHSKPTRAVNQAARCGKREAWLAMSDVLRYVVFTLDEQRYALHLSAVERVVRMVHVTPLPEAHRSVLGVINIQGCIIPVINTRRRFHHPERAIQVGDQLLIARAGGRSVALVADAVLGVIEKPPGEITAANRVLAGMEDVEGIVTLEDGMVLLHDLDNFEHDKTLHIANT